MIETGQLVKFIGSAHPLANPLTADWFKARDRKPPEPSPLVGLVLEVDFDEVRILWNGHVDPMWEGRWTLEAL
tara:strand:- start:905 stop:1123 length:219 start_codon:yes stop_codon:yes gene_type:complete